MTLEVKAVGTENAYLQSVDGAAASLPIQALLSDKANGKELSAVDRGQLFGSPQFEEFKL